MIGFNGLNNIKTIFILLAKVIIIDIWLFKIIG